MPSIPVVFFNPERVNVASVSQVAIVLSKLISNVNYIAVQIGHKDESTLFLFVF